MPTLFASEKTPQETFPAGLTSLHGNVSGQFERFVHKSDQSKILIYTDGTCFNDGLEDAHAGFGFVFRQEKPGVMGYAALRLENNGPSDEPHPQTGIRAELRAVLAALQFRYWPGENVKTLVIATESTYVAHGCTSWVHEWEKDNWQTEDGPVRNKDLWQALLQKFHYWSIEGLQLQFWKIPRNLNEAHRWARVGMYQDEVLAFREITGVMV